ncbi:hypothetical protein M1P56_16730 [Streptomyces sp. HU2014]|uniref:DUF7660 family protein n=1 Tax=Streptomyces sp. HU2014 TaxID=2939414 RepID=UPI00200EABBB|nr:hypothetical protein [Streptomyces sp. HU2014]UQI45886.1 hypothetical protein M1P56_16730 [Streptomyces sp. HU2014]
MDRSDAVALVQRIMNADCTAESEVAGWLDLLEGALGCPSGWESESTDPYFPGDHNEVDVWWAEYERGLPAPDDWPRLPDESATDHLDAWRRDFLDFLDREGQRRFPVTWEAAAKVWAARNRTRNARGLQPGEERLRRVPWRARNHRGAPHGRTGIRHSVAAATVRPSCRGQPDPRRLPGRRGRSLRAASSSGTRARGTLNHNQLLRPGGVEAMNWPDPTLNAIQSREDLADFLTELARKVREGDLSVENATTDSFVDSAGRWARSMDGFFMNVIKEPVPETPDWSMIAAIFRAALVYE